MESREEALLEEYYKTLRIEALTMSDMVREEILPACVAYEKDLADTVKVKKDAGVAGGMEAGLLGRVSALTEELYTKCSELDQAVADAPKDDSKQTVNYYHDVILAKMDEVRASCRSAGDAGGQEVLAVPDLLGYPVLRVSDNRAAGRTHAGCGSWKQPVVTAYNTMACTSRTERCGRCTPIFWRK